MPSAKKTTFEQEVAAEVRSSSQCGMCSLLASVDDDFAAEVKAALANRSNPGTAIARALVNRGHRITSGVVQSHRSNNHDLMAAQR